MRELLENIEFCWLGAFKVNIPVRSHSTLLTLFNCRPS
jgi:hypothetical protein